MKTDDVRNAHSWRDLWQRLTDRVLKPNAQNLAQIIYRGDIAVVLFEPFESALSCARSLGWDGERPIFRMSNGRRKRLAHVWEEVHGDKAAARWLRQRRRGRIFLIVNGGTLCINYEPDHGFDIEPGTLDQERIQRLH